MTTDASALAKHDLTQKVIQHLDRHLAIPLIEHLNEVGIFPADQLSKAHYDLVKGTNMVDYIQQVQEQMQAHGMETEKSGQLVLRGCRGSPDVVQTLTSCVPRRLRGIRVCRRRLNP